MVYGNNQKRANDLNREKWFFQNLAFCLENATIEAVFLMCAFSFLLTFFVYDWDTSQSCPQKQANQPRSELTSNW